MTCAKELLAALDAAARVGKFPVWIHDEENAVYGAMRVSGYRSAIGVCLIFEYIEYSVSEEMIQNVAVCLATFDIPTHLIIGDAITVDYSALLDPQSEDTHFGTIQVTSRGKVFDIKLDKKELIQEGYLESDATRPSVSSILFKICDEIPNQWLYNESAFLVDSFAMGHDAQRVFCLSEWRHPSLAEIYEEDRPPASFSNIVALVEAACRGKESPNVTGSPNTTWRTQTGATA